MKIFDLFQEPANYTLDLIKAIYKERNVDFAFIRASSKAALDRVGGVDVLEDMSSCAELIYLWKVLCRHDAIIINGYTGSACLLFIWLNIIFFKKPMALDSDTELKIPTNTVKRTIKWLWLHFLFTRKYCYGFAGGNYGHKDLFRHYGMAESRIFLMPMMVDNSHYRRNEVAMAHKPFRFGYLGRLIPLKQVNKAIEALPDGCELHIVGDGEVRVMLESASKGRNVCFHGSKFGDEKIRILHSFDCLVLYSSYESWGLVINEALASGIPVIVSDKVGARKDLVEGAEPTGLVARWNDVEDLSRRMRQMICDGPLYKKFSQNAIRRMREWDYMLYAKNFDAWARVIGS